MGATQAVTDRARIDGVTDKARIDGVTVEEITALIGASVEAVRSESEGEGTASSGVAEAGCAGVAEAGRAAVPPPIGEEIDPALDDVIATSADPWNRATEDVLEPDQIDALLVELRDLRQRIDRPVAHIAAAFAEARAWRALGHARQEDYAHTRLEKTGRWLRMTAALGRALNKFPSLDAAFTGEDGGRPLGKAAAVEIAAVATETDIEQWIERGRTVSFRQLQKDAQLARKQDARKKAPKPGGTHEWRSHTPPWELTKEELAELEAKEGPEAVAITLDVTLYCPPAMVVAFDETLELHRAVSGSQATITSFVEALVAEDGAGPEGPAEMSEKEEQSAWHSGTLRDSEDRPRRRDHPIWMDDTDPEARALRCRTDDHPAAPVLRDIARLAADVRHLELAATEAAARLAQEAGEEGMASHVDAHQLTDHLIAAGSIDAAIERAMARLLGALKRHRVWGWSGRGPGTDRKNNAPTWATGLAQYAEERLGISRSRARQLARVADRLRSYPILQDDWIQGLLATDKVLVFLPLFSVQDVPNSLQQAWSEHAQVTTVRRLEDEVRELQRRDLDRPPQAPPPAPLPDEEWHASLFRQPGRTLGRVTKLAEQLCEDPYSARNTMRLVLPFELSIRLMAAINRSCDREIERRKGQQTFSADGFSRKGTPWKRWLPPPYWYGLLQLLLDYAQTWDPPATAGQRRPEHAAIYEREGYRCLAPGCTGRRHLEAHHQEQRSQGGTDDPSNLMTLCAFHHRQGAHGLVMETSGPAPVQTRFTLGRGRQALTFRADKRLS